MPASNSVWGIDVGQCALKAIKLKEVNGELQVEAFDVIEHPRILSEPDVNRTELIRQALDDFLSRHNVSKNSVAVAVPGQSSFTRFVKLPPVEPKKIPDIVRFEAEQQIPFPINDVIWRWQTFTSSDSPDVEVGIFAMKKVDVGNVLDHFINAGMPVDFVQMAPLALYNFLTFDAQAADGGATLLADVGADKTDLVVADGPRIWTRTIQIGGNNFTEALVRAFKLSFPKAESLKRSAASSKYARQIFQAMRPVFADLQQEIQRSIGYYTSLHRDTRFKRMVGLGNGFRLPGLQKFLEQNLNLPVVRIDTYNKIKCGPSVNEAAFNENALSLAVAYGLAAQGLGVSDVTTNLLPGEIARKRVWSRKKPWFVAAAAVLLAALAGPLYRDYADKSALADVNPPLVKAQSLVQNVKRGTGQYQRLINESNQELERVKEYANLFGHREFWPTVQSVISEAIGKVATDQQLLTLYSAAGSDEERAKHLAQIAGKPRQQREMIFIEYQQSDYVPDVSNVNARDRLPTGGTAAGLSPAGSDGGMTASSYVDPSQVKRGFVITLRGRTTLGEVRANARLIQLMAQMEEIARQRPHLTVVKRQHAFMPAVANRPQAGSGAVASSSVGMPTIRSTPTRRDWDEVGGNPIRPSSNMTMPTAANVVRPDPLLPNEDEMNDTFFTIVLVVSIDSDGVTPPATTR